MLRTFNVQVTPKFPSWNQVGGWIEQVDAKDKAAAVKMVKGRVRREMLCDGPFSCKATEVFPTYYRPEIDGCDGVG